MDAAAEHVVVVVHHDALLGVYDLTLVALDVDHNSRAVLLLDNSDSTVRAALEPVVRHREEGASQRIEEGDGGRIGVWQSTNRRFLLWVQSRNILRWGKWIDTSLLKPCLPGIGFRCDLLEIFRNIARDVGICPWI